METLWAPWRLGYILGQKPTAADAAAPIEGQTGCIFCDKPNAGDDALNLMVARGKHSFVMLNLFPYNNGHVMVAPYRHVARLEDLTDEEAADIFQVACRIEPILRNAIGPDGFNVGMNVGKVAGAGIAGHLHLHVVPRWSGDNNFMPVLADTRVIPQALEAVRQLLAEPVQEALNKMRCLEERI